MKIEIKQEQELKWYENKDKNQMTTTPKTTTSKIWITITIAIKWK